MRAWIWEIWFIGSHNCNRPEVGELWPPGQIQLLCLVWPLNKNDFYWWIFAVDLMVGNTSFEPQFIEMLLHPENFILFITQPVLQNKKNSVYYYYSLYFANKIFVEIIFSLVMLSTYIIYLIFVSATWPLQKFSNPCNRCDTHTNLFLFPLHIPGRDTWLSPFSDKEAEEQCQIIPTWQSCESLRISLGLMLIRVFLCSPMLPSCLMHLKGSQCSRPFSLLSLGLGGNHCPVYTCPHFSRTVLSCSEMWCLVLSFYTHIF